MTLLEDLFMTGLSAGARLKLARSQVFLDPLVAESLRCLTHEGTVTALPPVLLPYARPWFCCARRSLKEAPPRSAFLAPKLSASCSLSRLAFSSRRFSFLAASRRSRSARRWASRSAWFWRRSSIWRARSASRRAARSAWFSWICRSLRPATPSGTNTMSLPAPPFWNATSRSPSLRWNCSTPLKVLDSPGTVAGRSCHTSAKLMASM
mmetsp:Transcript_9147/g.29156  ORF Transcript_9147/g.29156 Transcript_9147/m.29156 type:complete len:208 (+) Transcript_9147:175-798(+)